MHADEGSAGFHPVGKPLEIGKRESARGVAKHNGIDAVVAQRLWREGLEGFSHGRIELRLFEIRFYIKLPLCDGLFVFGEGGVVFVELLLGSIARRFARRLGRLGHLDVRLAEPGDDFEVRRGGIQRCEGFLAIGDRRVTEPHSGGAHEDALGGVGGFGYDG